MFIGPPWNPEHNASLRLDFSLTVVGTGLAGYLRYFDGYGDDWMSGTATAWGNFQATTDLHPTGCRADIVDACDQLGGYWTLVSAPTQSGVPAPSAFALMLAGLAGLIRRKWAWT